MRPRALLPHRQTRCRRRRRRRRRRRWWRPRVAVCLRQVLWKWATRKSTRRRAKRKKRPRRTSTKRTARTRTRARHGNKILTTTLTTISRVLGLGTTRTTNNNVRRPAALATIWTMRTTTSNRAAQGRRPAALATIRMMRTTSNHAAVHDRRLAVHDRRLAALDRRLAVHDANHRLVIETTNATDVGAGQDRQRVADSRANIKKEKKKKKANFTSTTYTRIFLLLFIVNGERLQARDELFRGTTLQIAGTTARGWW